MADIDDDDLMFAAEASDEDSACAGLPPWKILIVDDDTEVHAITRVVLGDVVFENRPLTFLSAESAAAARRILLEHEDIAAILLDVVMETDDAGLQLVRFIREELGNRHIRIILRTGQPGQAPERRVIVSYDINDYKAKSELTAQKLFTTTVAALRSYQHITTIEQGRRGLEKIVEGASSLMEQRAMKPFVEGVAIQMGALLQGARGSFLCAAGTDGPVLLSGSGPYEGLAGAPVRSVAPEVLGDVEAALASGSNLYRASHSVLVLRTRNHAASAILVQGDGPLPDLDRRLAEIFCGKIAIGFDNVFLYEQLNAAQQATVHALGKLAEFKDEVTGEHVKRIGRWATLIARKLQAGGAFPEADDRFCELIGLASMLHDVGKVAIPDAILGKPGKLDEDEMAIMRQHAGIGGRILREASGMVAGRNYLHLGAEIADGHHEWWDGSGYPNGLSGDEIPLSARIVSVADVYDALIHDRPYKSGWELTRVIELLKAESGRHFDPRVVDAFLAVLADEGVL